MLNDVDGVTCAEPEGRLLLLSQRDGPARAVRSAGASQTVRAQLADLLLETIKIAVVPGEAFGTPGFFRFSYALGDD
jgi:aspartate aminotransferase